MEKAYIEAVRLLLEAAPAVFEAPIFAMKSGTAINLFVEEMPRLLVDNRQRWLAFQASLSLLKYFLRNCSAASAERSG